MAPPAPVGIAPEHSEGWTTIRDKSRGGFAKAPGGGNCRGCLACANDQDGCRLSGGTTNGAESKWNSAYSITSTATTACSLLGSPQDRRGLRSRRVLRVSSRRTPLDAARHGALAERFPCRRGRAHDAPALRTPGLADAAPPSPAADRRNLHARSVERRPARPRLRARRRAYRTRILRRRSAGRAGDLCRGGRARDQGIDPQGAGLRRPAIFLQRGADGARAAAETASPDLVWASRARERRARGAPRSQRGQSRSDEGNAARHRALSHGLGASSWTRRRIAQARARPLHRRCAK